MKVTYIVITLTILVMAMLAYIGVSGGVLSQQAYIVIQTSLVSGIIAIAGATSSALFLFLKHRHDPELATKVAVEVMKQIYHPTMNTHSTPTPVKPKAKAKAKPKKKDSVNEELKRSTMKTAVEKGLEYAKAQVNRTREDKEE